MGQLPRYLIGAITIIAAGCAVLAGASALAATWWQVDLASGWATTAQPVATVMLAVALAASAVTFGRGLTAQRKMLATHRHLDVEPANVQGLRTRMLDGARMLAQDPATLRLVGVYELLAVADDWCRIARRSAHPQRILLEHQRCLELICGYLRANHRLERFVPGTIVGDGDEHDERIVRGQLCAGLCTHLTTWKHLGPFRVDLSGADLAAMVLRGRSLPGIIATGSVLTEADLSGSDLSGADLRETVAAGTRFTDTVLTDADLTRATAPFASFSGADLSGADLTDAVLRGAHLLSATLDRTELTGTDLTTAKLMRVDLRTATWESADLSGADLTDAQPAAVRDRSTATTTAIGVRK
ncbi:pentapeptide repeat-containing protein [Rhodococcus sp. NPDC003382]